MLSIKNNILYFIAFNILVQIQSLVELPAAEDNEIAKTESAIRNTVNNLFFSLKLRRVKHKARLKEFSVIHNFFASITLQDYDNLKEIARLVKVNNIDKTVQYFITQLNEVLNEDDKIYEATDDVYVTTYIETFRRKLEYLKYKYGLNNNISKFNINADVLKQLNTGKNDLQHLGGNIKHMNDTDRNILSNVEFWEPNGRRVYEGHRVKINRFPFMASVQFFKKFQCGGSIIKSDLVITSASCLQLAWNNRFFRENPSFLSVQVGCTFYEGGEENIPVLEVYFHPEYNPKNLANNLALLRLTRALNFRSKGNKIKKIEFDRDPWQLPQTINGITIVGWGARSTSNIISNPWSNRLGFAVLDFYPLRECQEVYSKEYVSMKNFCAGFFSRGGGACNRDIGGPGIAHGILVGVVSFGSPNCGAPDAPTVFTKLGYYSDWIENIMEQQELPSGRARTTERPPKGKGKGYPSKNNPQKTTTFKTYPITDRMGTMKPPILEVDALRILDENLLFKEFLTTMFGSEEVKDYLDQYESESELPESVQEKPAATTNKTNRVRVESTTEPTEDTNNRVPTTKEIHDSGIMPDIDNEPIIKDKESVRMVTKIENFDGLETTQDVTTPNGLIEYTALNNDGKEDDENIEKNIAQLINDIDIQELLEYGSKEESSNDAEHTVNTKKITTEKFDNSSKSEETEESDSENEENDLLVLDDTNNLKNETLKKTDVNEGLSIPMDPFKDFTFRQNASDILNFYSNADVMNFIKEALVESKRYKNMHKNHYTVTPFMKKFKSVET